MESGEDRGLGVSISASLGHNIIMTFYTCHDLNNTGSLAYGSFSNWLQLEAKD
jgi:hypothetical protein